MGLRMVAEAAAAKRMHAYIQRIDMICKSQIVLPIPIKAKNQAVENATICIWAV